MLWPPFLHPRPNYDQFFQIFMGMQVSHVKDIFSLRISQDLLGPPSGESFSGQSWEFDGVGNNLQAFGLESVFDAFCLTFARRNHTLTVFEGRSIDECIP